MIRLIVDGKILAEGVRTGNGERDQLPLGEWKTRDLYLPLIDQEATDSAPHEIFVPVIRGQGVP